MPAHKVDEKIRAKILEMYNSDQKMTYKQIASELGLSAWTVGNIVKLDKCKVGIDNDELDRKHAYVMEQRRKEHEEMTTWMEHVTPLHQHKQRLEAEIAAKQEALEKSKQEYRNFLATVKQLMEDTT